MKTKYEEFEVLVPNMDGTAVAERVKVMIPLRWDDELNDWLLTPEAHQIIEDTKARRIGLLLPAQLKKLRERYDYTQKEMGELFQVGEKSWTRWESGRHRPSRSINLLIRALYEGQISINYLLKRAGKPACEVETVAKMEPFPWLASASLPAEMAYFAHCLVASGKVIHFHSKGHGKSAFLKALSSLGVHQSSLIGPTIAAGVKPPGLLPPKAGHRFDYENVNLNSPSLA
jgi:DNA-binding transcriptional regulator YiaG